MADGDGGDDGLMFVEDHDRGGEGVDGDGGDGERNYKCAVDPQTGNLLLMEEDGGRYDENNALESAAASGDKGSGEVGGTVQASGGEMLTVLRVLENGEYILESYDGSLHNFRPMTKTGGVGDRESGEEEEACPEHQHDGHDDADIIVSNTTQDGEVTVLRVPAKRKEWWFTRKIFDLIRCVQNHEQKFIKWSKLRVWSVISADMRELGYPNCNKDECSKKWSNLLRTWKGVRLRPKALRTKWKYYSEVSNLIKSLSGRGRHRTRRSEDKTTIISESTRNLMMKLMSATKAHQEAIRTAEEEFKLKVDKLDGERDKLLCDINKSILHVNR